MYNDVYEYLTTVAVIIGTVLLYCIVFMLCSTTVCIVLCIGSKSAISKLLE